MPYNRSYRNKKQGYRKKGHYMKGRTMYNSPSSQVMTVGKVKRIISAELKFSLVGNDFIDISVASPMVVSLTANIAQGDTNL